MDSVPIPLLGSLISFVLMLFAGVAVFSKTTLLKTNRTELDLSAEKGDRRAASVKDLLENQAKLTGEVSSLYMTVGVISSVILLESTFSHVNSWLRSIEIFKNSATQLTAVLGTVIILICFLIIYTVLFSVVPSGIGSKYSRYNLSFAYHYIKFALFLMSPIIKISNTFGKLILRLFKTKLYDDSFDITEEHVIKMVSAVNETGVIEESQREMIENIFELDDMTARDIMTHRRDIVAAEIDNDVYELVKLSLQEGHSRIPIYKDEIDNIVGTVSVKDLLILLGEVHQDKSISDFLRETVYVPETVMCRDMLNEMRIKKIQLAVVVDEYGGTAGIVTLEDLIEVIVGSIQDEYDQEEEEEFIQRSDGSYVVDGSLQLDEFEEMLDISLPDRSDFDTVAGLILHILGRFPEQGELPTIQYDHYEFSILSMDGRRIERIKIIDLKNEKQEQDDNE